MLARWRQNARLIKRDVYALSLACRDPRVPWYAKALAVAVLTYALSPIDLIPDFIPVLGYLDDVLIVPVGIVLVRRLIPSDVMAEHRLAAAAALDAKAPGGKLGAAIVVGLWLLALAVCLYVARRLW